VVVNVPGTHGACAKDIELINKKIGKNIFFIIKSFDKDIHLLLFTKLLV
jgi:hypothetical protein